MLFACDGVDSAAPIVGPLPAGVWGNSEMSLRADDEGTTTMSRDCGGAELGVVTAVDGEVDVDFEWVIRPGDRPDSGTDLTRAANLKATVTLESIVGTLTEEGVAAEVELLAGVDTTFYECP